MPRPSRETVHIGELGLDGRLRPVPGRAAGRHGGGARGQAPRRSCRTRTRRRPRSWRASRCSARSRSPMWHGGTEPTSRTATSIRFRRRPVDPSAPATAELAEVIGQRDAVEALIAAAAGGHHMLDERTARRRQDDARQPAARDPARARRCSGPRGRRDPIPLGRSDRLPRTSPAARGAAPQREHRRAGRRGVARGAPGGDRAGDPRRAVPRRGRRIRSERARRPAPAVGEGRHHDRPSRAVGILPRVVPADPRHEPVPVRQLRRSRRQLRVPADGDPALPGTTVGPAARPRRHRAGLARVSVAHAAQLNARRRDDGCRRRPGRRSPCPRIAPPARHRLAAERPRVGPLAARRAARASSRRATADRCGTASRVAHPARDTTASCGWPGRWATSPGEPRRPSTTSDGRCS